MNKNVKIETVLTATVSGFDYRNVKVEGIKENGEKYTKDDIDKVTGEPIKDYSSVQIQSMTTNEETGEGEVKIFRINKETTPEQMSKLAGKTLKFETVIERPIDGKTFYSVSDLGKEVQSEKSIFDLNKSIVCVLDSVVEKEKKDFETKAISHDTVFQVFSMNGTKLTQKNIKLKDTKADKYKSLAGKKVRIDGIKISEYKGSIFFSITEAPKVI